VDIPGDLSEAKIKKTACKILRILEDRAGNPNYKVNITVILTTTKYFTKDYKDE